MDCPKCHAECAASAEICPACGIVFAKYLRYHGANPPSIADAENIRITLADDDMDTDSTLRQLLWGADAPMSGFGIGWRALLCLGLLVWSWRLLSAPIADNVVGESFLHLVNLPFHEAGHIIFRPFGSFITSLGGSLGQVLMPVICCATLLLKTRDPFGAAIALWWTGENFLDMAPYIDDARAGQLPLLGGNYGHSAPYGFHDWEYLLTESGLLQYDHVLARLSFGFGSLVMALALVWAGLLLHRQYREL